MAREDEHPETSNWRGRDGKLKACSEPGDDWLESLAATRAAASRPLLYLSATGYITLEQGAGAGAFRISVTARGADLARKLDSRLGRADLRYRDNKDGLIWVLVTVMVSFITTVLTNWLLA